MKEAVRKHNINLTVEAAAEYYLDENFLATVKSGKKVLTLHDNYVLFETSFINKPAFLEEAVFILNSNGYQPVLAHPERYSYVLSNPELLKTLKNMSVFFQVNLLSFTGYYSPEVKKMAIKLMKSGMIDFVGTDCHNAMQAELIKKSLKQKSIKTLLHTKLQNTTLL